MRQSHKSEYDDESDSDSPANSVDRQERDYAEFLRKYGHIDFGLLDFLPEIKASGSPVKHDQSENRSVSRRPRSIGRRNVNLSTVKEDPNEDNTFTHTHTHTDPPDADALSCT